MTTTKISVTLSDAPPVRIDPETWPVVASVDWHSGELACQANYVRRLYVRQHSDGRRLVYGWHERGPGGAPLSFRATYAGYLLTAENQDSVRAIRRVAGAIGDDDLGSECIADLPEEEI